MSHSHFLERAQGVRIAYSVTGPAGAPALLLSNSLATDASMWQRMLPELAQHYQVVTYDTRGHGQSTCPVGSPSLEDLGHDALAVLDALGISKAFMAGVSLGGMTGLTLALRQPERLLGLIACNCRGRIDAAGIAGWDQRVEVVQREGMSALVGPTLERWFAADYRAQAPEMMATMSSIIQTTSPAGYISCVNAIKGLDLHHALHQVSLPVLFIGGAQDGGAPPAEMNAMAAEVAGSRCEILDPCGHISSMQRPQDMLRLFFAFLKQHSEE